MLKRELAFETPYISVHSQETAEQFALRRHIAKCLRCFVAWFSRGVGQNGDFHDSCRTGKPLDSRLVHFVT